MFLLPSVCLDCNMDKKLILWCGWIVITVIDLSARNSYPAVYSSMAGGKETHELLPLALVHTQISRDAPQWSCRKGHLTEKSISVKLDCPFCVFVFSGDFIMYHH